MRKPKVLACFPSQRLFDAWRQPILVLPTRRWQVSHLPGILRKPCSHPGLRLLCQGGNLKSHLLPLQRTLYCNFPLHFLQSSAQGLAQTIP